MYKYFLLLIFSFFVLYNSSVNAEHHPNSNRWLSLPIKSSALYPIHQYLDIETINLRYYNGNGKLAEHKGHKFAAAWFMTTTNHPALDNTYMIKRKNYDLTCGIFKELEFIVFKDGNIHQQGDLRNKGNYKSVVPESVEDAELKSLNDWWTIIEKENSDSIK